MPAGGTHNFENGPRPDACNHAPNGLLILRHPEESHSGRVEGARLMGVTHTLLSAFRLKRAAGIQGMALMDRPCSMFVLS